MKTHPITEAMINRGPLPEGYAGCYWTQHGLDGQEPYAPTPRTVPAPTGWMEDGRPKSNYTTSFTQAVIKAASLWRDQLRTGSQTDREALQNQSDTVSLVGLGRRAGLAHPWRVFAMALHDYKKSGSKIDLPCYVQPKYDGVLFMAVGHPSLPKQRVTPYTWTDGAAVAGRAFRANIDGYSRKRETLGTVDHLLAALYPLYKSERRFHGVHFVGEIWSEGYSLQDISGYVRRTASSSRGESDRLEWWIFDCFSVEDPEMGFEERLDILQAAEECLDAANPDQPWIHWVATTTCDTREAVQALYRQHLRTGLEGSIVRDITSQYEYGVDGERRSYGTQKLKPRPDAEWPIVGFTTGKRGKGVGQVIWICAESDAGVTKRLGGMIPLEERLTFHTTANLPQDTNRTIYQAINLEGVFDRMVYGQLATVSYTTLSRNGLPLTCKWLRFRDPGLLGKLVKLVQPE
jgi:hypothetical protein